MKNLIIFFAVLICFCFNGNLKAQAVKIEKFGVILTKEDISEEYFLENTTKDSIKVVVVNHQEKIEDLGSGIIAVSDGEHAKVDFVIPPKAKISLNYIICIHSTGLLIGSADNNSNLLEYKFYPIKN